MKRRSKVVPTSPSKRQRENVDSAQLPLPLPLSLSLAVSCHRCRSCSCSCSGSGLRPCGRINIETVDQNVSIAERREVVELAAAGAAASPTTSATTTATATTTAAATATATATATTTGTTTTTAPNPTLKPVQRHRTPLSLHASSHSCRQEQRLDAVPEGKETTGFRKVFGKQCVLAPAHDAPERLFKFERQL